MATGNFLRGDEPYIYVPKIFRKKRINYEDINEEIEFIFEQVLEKVRNYLNGLKKLEDYGISKKTEPSPSYSKEGYIIDLYHFFEGGDYDSNSIYFYFVNGYYEAGNFGYEVTRSQYVPKYIDNITEKVCDIIEKELKRYCDKYEVLWKASNGETAYRKITNKKAKAYPEIS